MQSANAEETMSYRSCRRHLRIERLPVRHCGSTPTPDRGVQYVSIRRTEQLAEAGIESSVGSVGDFYDDALAKTINGLYKAKVIHRRPWRNLEAVELATLDWINWFNHRRLLGQIGNLPPAESEAQYHRQQAALPLAA